MDERKIGGSRGKTKKKKERELTEEEEREKKRKKSHTTVSISLMRKYYLAIYPLIHHKSTFHPVLP